MNRRDWMKTLAAAPFAAGAGVETVSGKGRLRPAICAYSFRKELQAKTMTYEDLIPLAVDTDVDGLDLTVYWLPSTADDFLFKLRRMAYRSAVELYSISVRTDMCQPTADKQRGEADKIRGWVDVAYKLGASHIRVFGGKVPEGATEDAAAGWVAEILKTASDYAGRHGVILGLENHGGITARAARIVEIVRKVDSPWVGINLDTGNFTSDVYPQIEICLPYAVNVQVKVNVKSGGKTEPSDWARVVKMLNGAGYKGYLALEYEEKEDARTAVPAHLRRLKQAIGRG